jgi:hypothetical protein
MAGIILPEVDHNNPFNVSPHGLRPGGSTAHGPTSPRKESTVNPSSPRRTSQTPRRKSSAAQIELPTASEAEIRALAKVFHARLGTLPIDDRNSAGKFLSWLDLFNHMDLDGSGGVDFAEFEWMIRKELGVHVSSLPNETLRALWNALDLDRSGAISFGEFGHFMRYCAKGTPAPRARATRRTAARHAHALTCALALAWVHRRGRGLLPVGRHQTWPVGPAHGGRAVGPQRELRAAVGRDDAL